jgi:hypothetical protein
MARGAHLRQESPAIQKGQLDPGVVEVYDLQLDSGDALFFENRITYTAAPTQSDPVSRTVPYG